jgi:hypothetical protein
MNCLCKKTVTILNLPFTRGVKYPYKKIFFSDGSHTYFMAYPDHTDVWYRIYAHEFEPNFYDIAEIRKKKLEAILNSEFSRISI